MRRGKKYTIPPPAQDTFLTSSSGGRRGSTAPVSGERVSPRHPGIVVDVNRHKFISTPVRRTPLRPRCSVPHRFRPHPLRTAGAEIFLTELRPDLHRSWLRGELVRACTAAAVVYGHGCAAAARAPQPHHNTHPTRHVLYSQENHPRALCDTYDSLVW